MKNPKESASQSPPAIEWTTKYWREMLAVGLWVIALWGLYQAFTPSCGALDSRYSQGVYCAVTERVNSAKTVNHQLLVGFSREHKLPDGTIVVPEGQFFIALQSCPVILKDDDAWMMTSCSVTDIIR